MTHRRGRGAAWFTEEVAVHLDAVYRFFVRRTARQDADDLTSDVFATAWRRRQDLPEEAILPWLYRAAGFVLANHRRRASSLPLHLVQEPVAADHALRIADRDRLSRALAAVSERDRDILLLHAWEGLDGRELADALGISRSGAQAALSRARTRLREVWAGVMQDDDASRHIPSDSNPTG